MRILITYFSILFCFPQQSFQRMKIKTIDSMSINIVFIQIQNTSIQNSTTFPTSYLYFFFRRERDTYLLLEAFKTYAFRASKLFNSFIDFVLLFILFNTICSVRFYSFPLSATQILTKKYLIYLIFFSSFFLFHSFSLVLFRSQRLLEHPYQFSKSGIVLYFYFANNVNEEGKCNQIDIIELTDWDLICSSP